MELNNHIKILNKEEAKKAEIEMLKTLGKLGQSARLEMEQEREIDNLLTSDSIDSITKTVKNILSNEGDKFSYDSKTENKISSDKNKISSDENKTILNKQNKNLFELSINELIEKILYLQSEVEKANFNSKDKKEDDSDTFYEGISELKEELRKENEELLKAIAKANEQVEKLENKVSMQQNLLDKIENAPLSNSTKNMIKDCTNSLKGDINNIFGKKYNIDKAYNDMNKRMIEVKNELIQEVNEKLNGAIDKQNEDLKEMKADMGQLAKRINMLYGSKEDGLLIDKEDLKALIEDFNEKCAEKVNQNPKKDNQDIDLDFLNNINNLIK